MNNKDMRGEEMNKKLLCFILIFFILLSFFQGCIQQSDNATPLKLVKVYHPRYYALADINYLGIAYEILPYPSVSPELPLPGSEAYFRNKVIFEFNQELSPKQEVPFFYLNGGATGLILPEGTKPRLEPFDWMYMSETFYEIEGNKIIMTAKIAFGMDMPVFLLPKGLSAKSGVTLENDILVYLTAGWLPEERWWEIDAEFEGITIIPKKKGDNRKIGVPGVNNVSLFSKPNGEKIMELFCGDNIEVIGEEGNFYEVRLLTRVKGTEPPEEPTKPEEVIGFIEKKYFIPLPEPLNEGSYVVAGSVIHESLPYLISFGVVPFPIGLAGSGVSITPGFEKQKPLSEFTPQDVGLLEAMGIISTVENCAGPTLGFFGSSDQKNTPTTFSDPKNQYPFMLLTEEEFEVAERFREEYTDDLVKIMENFTLPDKIKDMRAPIVELIKKNAELVMIAENWAFKYKGKNEEELFTALANAVGRDDKEKQEIYEILAHKVYFPDENKISNFSHAVNELFDHLGIMKTLREPIATLSHTIDETFFPGLFPKGTSN